jgi:hypothetical protein
VASSVGPGSSPILNAAARVAGTAERNRGGYDVRLLRRRFLFSEMVMAMKPRAGDVLVSNRTATLEHDVSIVPAAPDLVCPNHDSAVGLAREMAKDRGVDAWLTEDHTHFLQIAAHRQQRGLTRV